MKFVLVIIVAAFLGAHSAPLQDKSINGDERWTIARDGEGRMHLVDLDPLEVEPETFFDPNGDMFYLLYTSSNPTEGQRITFDVESLTNFRRNGSTRVLIHGWTTSSMSTENIFTRNEFLAQGDHNVIAVDWSVGASANYITSRNRVSVVGQAVARFLDFLHSNGYIQYHQVHLIGHSLGSHVAGHVGKNVQGGRINVIFGTDPAGPLFNTNNPDRLDSSDAEYTEAIHTNAGLSGISEPITHAAFYPNFGSSQPGCENESGGSCNHARGPLFYSESIRSDLFIARQCTGYDQIVARNCPGTGVVAIMGGDSAKSIRGVFYLETNAQAPFARG
ncbi:hypothetical protein ACKWTF_016233 [Chironomus riparius]